MIRLSILLVALGLAGCGGAQTDERDTAAGKILPGSASDAMLQTDRLQSEAPLAAPKLAQGDETADAPGVRAPKAADEPNVAETPEADPAAAPPATAPAPGSAPTPPSA